MTRLSSPQSNVTDYCSAISYLICAFKSSFLLQRPFEVPVLGWVSGWVGEWRSAI